MTRRRRPRARRHPLSPDQDRQGKFRTCRVHQQARPQPPIPTASAALTQGGIIAQTVFVILVIMSAASWYILFTKLIEQQKIINQAQAVRSTLLAVAEPPRGRATSSRRTAPIARSSTTPCAPRTQHGKLTDPIDQHDWMHELAGAQPGRDHLEARRRPRRSSRRSVRPRRSSACSAPSSASTAR